MGNCNLGFKRIAKDEVESRIIDETWNTINGQETSDWGLEDSEIFYDQLSGILGCVMDEPEGNPWGIIATEKQIKAIINDWAANAKKAQMDSMERWDKIISWFEENSK
jgi:hypothetical protein